MPLVRLSRYTAGLPNGQGVAFKVGDEVTYELFSGDRITAKITSEFSKHDNGRFGYEATCSDTGATAFIDECRIVGWE